jgi:hypothetical protein
MTTTKYFFHPRNNVFMMRIFSKKSFMIVVECFALKNVLENKENEEVKRERFCLFIEAV